MVRRSTRFLASVPVLALCVCGISRSLASCGPEGPYPGEVWQKAKRPEQLGWSLKKLARARAYSEKIGSAAVMIVDDGLVIDSWGDVDRSYHCHSMRKSLLSAMIGIYVEEGTLDLSKTMGDLRIDDNEPSLTEAEKQATLGDLILARSGVYHPALGEAPSMKEARPKRGSHAPGTFWYYNNWDFNVLGTICERATGSTVFDEFDRLFAKPLQMQDFSVENCRHLTTDPGSSERLSIHRYYEFRMSTRDLARFGLLFLREGRWADRQIVSREWICESTTEHSKVGGEGGYGYMWWTGNGKGLFPNVTVKQDSYYASGASAHKLIVLPYRNLVVVHREDTDDPDPDKKITDSHIGTLLWLILDAAGENGIGDSPFIDAAEGSRLATDTIRTTLAGSTLVYDADGEKRRVLFGKDGKMIETKGMSREPVSAGTWGAEDDIFLYRLEGSNETEPTRRKLLLDGNILKFFTPDGTFFGQGILTVPQPSEARSPFR